MSFLPARMIRILVGGHQAHLPAVISTLQTEGVLHIEDYRDASGITRIGTPLHEGAQASELLVRARGLLKAMGAEPVKIVVAAPADSAAVLARADKAAAPILETTSRLRSEHAALEAEKLALAPYASLGAELSALHGLTSVKVFLGQSRGDPLAALAASRLSHDGESTAFGSGFAFYAIVAASDSAAAEKTLSAADYVAGNLPAGRKGTPAERRAAIDAELARVNGELAKNAADLATLRSTVGGDLAAAEQALAAQVERTQAPLRFGVTAMTFNVEGWAPANHVNRLRNVLAAEFGDSLYMRELGDAPALEAPATGEHHVVEARDEPPIHLQNKGPAGNFEFMLGLLGKPRYWEIDPTKLMFIFFPLFFGLMVGDLAVGLIIMGVGFWLRTNKVFGIGGGGVAKPLIYGGLMAALVGGFVFGEALGIHFVTPDPHGEGESKDMSWEDILGLHLPSEGLIHKSGGHDTITTTLTGGDTVPGGITTHAEAVVVLEEEKTGGGLGTLLAPHTDVHLLVAGVPLGIYSKIHDIQALLVWSVLIGLVHLNLGFMLGVRNVGKAHGIKLAVQEKLAWMLLQVGIGIAIWGLLGGPALALPIGGALAAASVALLWAGAQTVLGAGFIAILEVFGLVGNLLSYTRLAAIGASKAGMVIAFTAIGFETLGGGNIHSVIGWIVYLIGMLLIIVLSMLAGGLQSLRLQFVEFFQKFFTGGGRPYVPFGRRAL